MFEKERELLQDWASQLRDGLEVYDQSLSTGDDNAEVIASIERLIGLTLAHEPRSDADERRYCEESAHQFMEAEGIQGSFSAVAGWVYAQRGVARAEVHGDNFVPARHLQECKTELAAMQAEIERLTENRRRSIEILAGDVSASEAKRETLREAAKQVDDYLTWVCGNLKRQIEIDDVTEVRDAIRAAIEASE